MSVSFPWSSAGLCALLCALGWGGVAHGVAMGAEPGLPDQVRRALDENASALSPLRVTWEQTRSSPWTVSQVLAKLKMPDTARDVMAPQKVEVKLQGNKFYVHYWRSMAQAEAHSKGGPRSDLPLLLVEQEVAFDGSKFYNGSPGRLDGAQQGDANVHIEGIERIVQPPGDRVLADPVYFYMAGFRVPSTARDWTSARPKSLLQSVLDQGGKIGGVREERLGEEAVLSVEVLKEGEKTVFALDPAKRYALRRRTAWYPSGSLAATVDCLDFVRLQDPDLWLPKRIEVDQHVDKDPQLLMHDTYAVSVVSRAPIAPEELAVSYKAPGSWVTDDTIPGAEGLKEGKVTYRVPASAEELDEAIALAMGKVPQRAPLSRSILALNVVALAILLVVVLYWRIRRSKTARA